MKVWIFKILHNLEGNSLAKLILLGKVTQLNLVLGKSLSLLLNQPEEKINNIGNKSKRFI